MEKGQEGDERAEAPPEGELFFFFFLRKVEVEQREFFGFLSCSRRPLPRSPPLFLFLVGIDALENAMKASNVP